MNRQRGFAALMLMLLVLLLLAIPTMYLEHELRERQRALDRRIKKMLAPTPVPASEPSTSGANARPANRLEHNGRAPPLPSLGLMALNQSGRNACSGLRVEDGEVQGGSTNP